MEKKELINLTIINDSDCTLSIPLFQNNVTSINATTKYQWDITSANISCGFGSIVINGSLFSITYVPTLTGLVDSLNALNYGYFCTEVIGANTYIYTKDNINIYSLLDLCPTPTPTTTTTTTTTSTTSTTTTAAPTTSTTTTSTTAIPTTSTTTTSTTTIPTTTTSTTSTTTTAAPTTSTTTTSTTAIPTTSTTTTSTTTIPTTTTSTTSTTTTAAPTTSTTTTSTTAIPTTTTSTTSTSTTAIPTTTTSTTTSTTTEAPTTTTTTTSTTTSTTTEAPTTTSTTTSTTTAQPFLNMSLGATYTGVSEMLIRLNIVGTLPDSGVLFFQWCTDSGAEGDATYNLNSGITGDCDIPNINLSSVGTFSLSTAWGSFTYNVVVSSSTTVSQFYVKVATLTYTTADTITQYVIDFVSVDNACANPQTETNYCVANCS